MYCKLDESNDIRRKYIIYLNKEELFELTKEYFHDEMIVGYIIIEKNNECWHIELMNIIYSRKGFGSFLLDFVLKDIKQFTSLVTVHPVTNESRKFFIKKGFDQGFKDKSYLFYKNI